MEERGLSSAEMRMASEPMRSLIIKYSIPTMIGMSVNSLYTIADRFWVGKIPDVGNAALAGLGFSMPIVNMILALSMLIGVGAAARISIQLGEKNFKDAEETVANGLTMICIIAIAFSVLGVIFAPQLLRLFGATDDLMEYALPYTRIIVGGSFFNMTSFALNHPIRATGNPKRFAMTQLIGGITSMILDPILILVLGWGIVGAAVSTVIAQSLSAVSVFAYYFSQNSVLRFKLRNFALRRRTMRNILSIGLSQFTMQIANSFTLIAANRALKHYGILTLGEGGDITAIGAMTIVSTISTMFLMPVIGINQGAQPIVGFNYGRRNAERVKSAFRWAVTYAMSVTIIGLLVVLFLAEYLVRIFNQDGELIRVGASGMRIMLCSLPIIGFQFPSLIFFQSIGRAKISIMLCVLRQIFILIPAYYLLPISFGLRGVWMAQPFSDFSSSIIIMMLLLREFKIIDSKLGEGDLIVKNTE